MHAVHSLELQVVFCTNVPHKTVSLRVIEELKNSSPDRCTLRDVLATTPEGVNYIIEILQFVMQQRR